MLRGVLIFIFLGLNPVAAVEPDEIMADPLQEERARLISKDLRCLVCRNENIDSSNAGIARDLRILVRERIKNGDSNEEVISFITDRYGDYVLLRPRLSLYNLFLWATGPLVFLLGLFIIWRILATKNDEELQKPLTVKEKKRLEQMLDDY